MLALAGEMALFLGDVGIYALFAYLTSPGAQAISIDMALGTELGRLLHLITVRAVKLVLVGFPLGFAIALVLIRVAPSEFPLRRHPTSAMFLGIALLLGLMPLAAYYLLLQCRKSRV